MKIIVNPVINYINHLFVMLGFNYTIGCPIEVFGKIPYEDVVSIIKTEFIEGVLVHINVSIIFGIVIC